ncbi:MAG: N-acetylmuramoyl-L-alanine amidase [Planctomycetota bacterium]
MMTPWTARWGLVAALVLTSACSSTPEPRPRNWQHTLDFAATMIARGDHGPAQAALLDLRYRKGDVEDRVRGFKLLGDAELGLENWEAALNGYHRARALNRDSDLEFVRATAFGLGRANQGLKRWTSAERHFEEALSSSVESKQRDRVRIFLAKGALAQSRLSLARRWLAGVRDPSAFQFRELAEKVSLSDGLPAGQGATPQGARALSDADAPAKFLAPRILPREEWAAASLRMRGKPVRMTRPYRMTIHHGGDGKAAPTDKAAATKVMRAYQREHFGRGWADIGYHFVIDGAGRVWEARSMDWQGAHAGTEALNRGNIGICCMGTFETVTPSEAQKRSLSQLVRFLTSRYKIPWQQVRGHDETLSSEQGRATACPGARLSTYLDFLRADLRSE